GRSARADRSRPESALIDPRLQARRREVERGKGRRRLRRLVVLLVLILIGGAVYGTTRSALLDVDHVRVSGVAGERADAVSAAAAIDRGTPLTSVDTASAARRVAGLAWVLDVEVER